MKGFLYAEYRGLCGRCNGGIYITSKEEEVEAQAKEKGWRYTMDRGWLCPHCVQWLRKNDQFIRRRDNDSDRLQFRLDM